MQLAPQAARGLWLNLLMYRKTDIETHSEIRMDMDYTVLKALLMTSGSGTSGSSGCALHASLSHTLHPGCLDLASRALPLLTCLTCAC